MKTKIKRSIVYLSAALMLLAASTSYAVPDFKGPRREGKEEKVHEKIYQDMTEKLDLSEEQKEQLNTHRGRQKARMKELKKELKTTHEALRKELKNCDSDESAIKSTVTRLKKVQAQLLDQKVDNFLAMREILTPEQFRKMNELREERRKQRLEKKQGRKKHPGKRF